MQGARNMLYYLYDKGCLNLSPGISKKQGNRAYSLAVYNWLMEDFANIEHFLSGGQYYFTDFKKDNKGNLLSCRVTTKINNEP